jgi:flagellar hook-length control protein FliK
VEIRLAPQNLGSLTIEMAKDANGALQVVLHASNAKAAGVLNQHLDGLQAALRGYSQEEVRIEVQRSDESQQQNFRQADPDGRGNQQRQQQERREEEHTGDAFMQKLRLGLFGADAL